MQFLFSVMKLNSFSTLVPAAAIAQLLGGAVLAQAQAFALKPGWNGIFAQADASRQSLNSLVPDAKGPVGSPAGVVSLTLRECLDRVVTHNETVQMRMIEWQITRKRHQGEKGIFEPEMIQTSDRVESARANTIEQTLAQNPFGSGTSVFNQKNNTYNVGIEALQPLGTRLRVGYSLRDLNNNLNGTRFPGGEFESSISLTLTQPLLKNAGVAVTTAAIRLAAIASDAAYQDYRKQFMQIVAGTEAAYWDLHLAQEQLRLAQDSHKVADTILTDNRTRLAAGKATELDVLQAQAGVVFRQARGAEAEQKLVDATGRLASFLGQQVSGTANAQGESRPTMRAVDQPGAKSVSWTFGESMSRAIEANPDYLSRRKQIESSRIRLAYAQNQRWPQLDLKASYGLNGLGDSPSSSFDQITHSDFPAWSLGVELRIPLAGGIKSRAELAGAKLGVQQGLLGLQEIETQLGNAIETALRKARSASANVTNLQALADYTQTVLTAQIDRLNAGKTDSRTVLETEEKLFEARIAVVDSLVQSERARLELELIQGTLLHERKLDLTAAELETRTLAGLTGRRVDAAEFTQMKVAAKTHYDRKMEPAAATEIRAQPPAPLPTAQQR